MWIQLFDVKDKKLVPNQATYMVPELKAIINNFPDEYLKVLWYVFSKTCPDGTNPYINIEETRREEVIIADISPFKFWIEDLSIEAAIRKCEELYETPALRAYRGAKRMLDKIATYLDEQEITDGKEGTATTIRGMMKELPDFWNTYRKMEDELNKEQAKVRGGLKLRYDQRPGYSDSKKEKDEPE